MQERLGQPVVIENRPGAGGTLGNEAVARADKDGYTHRHHDRRPDHRGGDEQVAALRHAHRVRSDLAGRDRRPDHRHAPGLPGQQRQGAGRGRQGQSRQARRSRARASAPPSISPPSCSGRPPASTCCTCRSAPRRRRSRPCSASRWTCCSIPSRRCSVRCSPASSRRSRSPARTASRRCRTCRRRSSPACCPGYDVTTWYGFFAPRGTPPAVVAKLNKTLNEILKEEAVRERLTKAGVVVQGSTARGVRQAPGERARALERGARGGRHPAAVACYPGAAFAQDVDRDAMRLVGRPESRNRSRPAEESPGSARPCSRWRARP